MITFRLFASGALMTALLAGTALSQETGSPRPLTLGKGGTLQIRLSAGSITMETWDKRSVEIRGGARSSDLRRWTIEQQGGDIRISDNLAEGGGGEDLVLNAPRECNVDVKTSAGNIELRGALDGDLQAQTSGGDIQLGDVGKQLDIATAGGNVSVGDIGGDGRIASSGGDIRVRNVRRTLEASTAGGNITVGDIGGDGHINSAGGNLRAGKVAGRVSLSTAGGNIELEAASGTAQLTTSGGDLMAREVTGSLAASTAGGSIDATLIPSGKGRSHLSSAGGDLILSLPGNAKATIEATIHLQGAEGNREEYQIRSDFPADRQDQGDQHTIRARYLLNGGGERINLSTVNSNIYIKRIAR